MKVRKLDRRGAVRWVADLGLVGERRMSRTFGTHDEASAWLEAKRIERRNLGDVALALTDAKRIEFLGAEQRLAGIASVMEAVEFFLRFRQSVAAITVRDALKARQESLQQSNAVRLSVNASRSVLNRVFLGNEDKLVSSITLSDLEAGVGRDNPAAATRRTRVGYCRAFFAFCLSRKYILTDISRQIPKPRYENKAPKILTAEQVSKLFELAATADPDIAANLALVAFGGLRPMEALRLPEGSIGKDHINVPAASAKTRQRRLVAITPTLRAWLKVGNPYRPKNAWNRLLAIRRAGGIPWAQDILRHSFCSYAFAAFGARWSAEQAGHSEQMLFSHYREVVTPADAKRYWAIRP